MNKVLTTCIYCGCGCGMYLVSHNGTIIGSQASCNHPVSQGALCVKGWNAYEFVNSLDRLTSPLIKEQNKFRQAGWDEALNLVANKLTEISKKYGPDSVAFLGSAKATNEENYLMMKLSRAVFKTNNIDHCARLCHASTVAGLAASFGSGAMTNSINEFSEADCFLVTGSDTTGQHPLIGSRIINAIHNRKARLLLFDPRKIELSKYAYIHAQQKNGTDVCWINGLMHIIIKENLQDQAYIDSRTEGYNELKELVKDYTPEYVEKITRIPKEKLIEAARVYAKTKRAMIVYSMGITQHTTGVDNVKSLANLAMLTGHIGVPYAGVNPLRGQNNVQGACDVGALPNVYSGYQAVGDPAIRKKFEEAWHVDSLPVNVGLTVTEVTRGILEGKVKAVYIMGENPVISDPDSHHVRKAFEKVEFLAINEMFLSDTAEYAHVVLPAASFAEKDGTFTNTERRVERIRIAKEPLKGVKPDWLIFCEIAKRCGYKYMDFESPAEIMDEMASLTPIYGGISFDRLDPFGLQWPCPTKEHPGTPVLHKEKFTRGKGALLPKPYMPPAEETDEEYNFILSTGRVYWHWHTRTMTNRTSTLERESPVPYVELNPKDAAALNIRNGEMVKVASRRGQITLQAKVSDIVVEKSLFIPFHYREAAANILTILAVDPIAKIPEYKVCAAKIEKI